MMRIYPKMNMSSIIRYIQDKKKSDGRNPIPYYLISFLGDYFKNCKNTKVELDKIFFDEASIKASYEWLKDITTEYFKMYVDEHKEDYNRMIKQKIDETLLKNIKESYIRWGKREDSIVKILQN